jgi:integrase
MARGKQSYRTGGPSKDPTRHKSPYWCKWYEIVTDNSGSSEVPKSKWFPTLEEARVHGEKITCNRADARDFTDQERLQAIHFFRECEMRHLSPFDVFAAGLKHYGAEKSTEIPLSEAAELFCIWMTGEKYSTKTITGYEGSLNWMQRWTDPKRSVSTYTANELVSLVKGRYANHTSRQAFLRDLKSFFNWAARQGYCSQDVAREAMLNPNRTKSSAMKSAQRRTHKRPPRLRAEQIKPMFDAVDIRYHAALALAVFAGLRPESELPSIEWSMEENGHRYGVDFDGHTISLHENWVTKTRMERTLHDLPEPLWTILAQHRQKSGRISPLNYRNWRKLVIKPIKAALDMATLPTDVLRHTALSFQNVLAGQSVTMNNAGHTNPKTFYQRYNNAVGKKEAEEFSSLEI